MVCTEDESSDLSWAYLAIDVLICKLCCFCISSSLLFPRYWREELIMLEW